MGVDEMSNAVSDSAGDYDVDEKAMAKIANIEFGLDELDGLALARKKFNYVISAQIYQRQKDRGDSKAEDIEFIMRKFVFAGSIP